MAGGRRRRGVVGARFRTQRDKRYRTFGPAVGRIAEALGWPLQRWQREVLDTGLEVDENGEYRYSDIVVTVQRQAGKSTLALPAGLQRAMSKRSGRAFITSQTRQVASDLVMRELAPAVLSSDVRSVCSVRRSVGSEGILVPETNGLFAPFPPDEDGLHGKRADLAVVDEVWAHKLTAGVALEQAVRPTLTTTGGQALWTSTAGTRDSTLLRRLVDRGRAGSPGIAYFEYSLDDLTAREVDRLLREGEPGGIERAVDLTIENHPGEFVHRAPVLSAAGSMGPDEFLRGYGNRWTATEETLFPPERWTECLATGEWPVPAAKLALGIDGTPELDHVVIAIAWRDANGLLYVDVVKEGGAGPEMTSALVSFRDRLKPVAVAFDSGGPAKPIADDAVARSGLRRTMGLSTSDYSSACGQLLRGVVNGGIRHRGVDSLDSAVRVAQKRAVSDRFVFDRRSGDVAALGAVTAAMWGLDHAKRERKPEAPSMQ